MSPLADCGMSRGLQGVALGEGDKGTSGWEWGGGGERCSKSSPAVGLTGAFGRGSAEGMKQDL